MRLGWKLPKGLANVLVTGGARRIGRAIVEDLACNGFGVGIHCNRSCGEGNELAQAINAKGGRAVVVEADLTDLSEAAGLIRETESRLGPVSILVNNASLFERDVVTDLNWETWDRHFAIHLKAPVALARALAESLPAQADGLVVNVIDQRVLRPNPTYFSYTLSKSALWAATVTMAQALAPRIRVNAIGPGPTVMNTRQYPADFAAQLDGLILKRGPELAEFGATIRYLWQTRSITGQLIALDGGQHLAWETPDVTGMIE
jgi:NAD(P)-dependent dehydrogenase (short-subunit alcohol dehydrogenase family)